MPRIIWIVFLSLTFASCASMWEGMGTTSLERAADMEAQIAEMEAQLARTEKKLSEAEERLALAEAMKEDLEKMEIALQELKKALEEDIPSKTIQRIGEILLESSASE